MNLIYSIFLIIGSLFGTMNALPIYQPPHHNQIKIDTNPAIVVTKPTQPPASFYILDNKPGEVRQNLPPVISDISLDQILNTNGDDEVTFENSPAIVPPPPPPAPPGPILYEPLEFGPVIESKSESENELVKNQPVNEM
jgi:hypothetical protein